MGLAPFEVTKGAAVLVAVVAAFVIVITFGPALHESFPAIPQTVLGAFLGCVCVLVAFLIAGLLLGWRIPPYFANVARRRRAKEHANRQYSAFEEAKRARMAELATDPKRIKYVPNVERGESWSDEQIAYQENPDANATCVHLRSIERAMRSADIALRLEADAKVQANCCIHPQELSNVFPLPVSVRYDTGYYPERCETDNPWARLSCKECRSTIDLIHPEAAKSRTPWFPV